MARGIKFENIDTKETLLIGPDNEGKYYGAKLSAVINSSNMSINADRGQDYGWRLDAEQQALIEEWEQDPMMIERVSQLTNVPVDSLSHADFLAYLIHQQKIGTSPERREVAIRRERQQEYDARVDALRKTKKPEPMAPFKAPTVEDFLKGDLTGDAGGDKVTDEPAGADWSGDQGLNDAIEAAEAQPKNADGSPILPPNDPPQIQTPVVPEPVKAAEPDKSSKPKSTSTKK